MTPAIVRGVVVALVCVLGVGACTTTRSTRQTATTITTPRSSPPSYLAVRYGRAGQPALSTRDAAKLRFVLSRVKPCQRRFVRYAFTDIGFVLYFPDLTLPNAPHQGIEFVHTLGDAFTFYAPRTGDTHVGPIGADDPEGDPRFTNEYRWGTDFPCSAARR